MPSRPDPSEVRRLGARHVVALTTVLAFGCATVRAPVSVIGPTVPVHGSTAEPQVELWLESAADLTPAESARAAEEAREALRQALQDRKLGDDDVLVVRAQAVSRTRSHRDDQRAAVAGLVVGFVALVALAVVASRGSGSPVQVVPDRAGGGARRVPRGPPPVGLPSPRRPGLAPADGPGGVNVDVEAAVVAGPGEAAPAVEASVAEQPPPSAHAAPSLPAPAGERISAVSLPAPPPLVPDGRSFFESDWVRLELIVVDARTGAARWTKVVTEDADVRDVGAVRALIDDALASEAGWEAPSAAAR